MSLPVSSFNALGAAFLAMTLPISLTAQDASPELVARAKAIHAKVLTIDTHVDIRPSNFELANPNYGTGLVRTKVDIPKMEKGGLDGAFLIVYVGQNKNLNPEGYADAYQQAMTKFEAIHRLVEQIAPDRAELALTAADARRIHASGKRVIFIGIENGFPIGTDITNVKKFYDLGGRYMSLAHNGHSQLSDSNTGEADGVWLHHGLSELGREVIKEMNRVGIMVDVSHPSKESMMQTLEITRAPIIASHSATRALCNNSRNLDDEQLRALAKNGGVAQIVAFGSYLRCDLASDPARSAAMDSLAKEFALDGLTRGAAGAVLESMSEARRNTYMARRQEISNRRYPGDVVATVSDLVDHIDHAVEVAGIDHVGISSDFDGGGGVEGWNSAEETFNVTLELVRRGYTEEQIRKIWGGNLLRVMAAVEKAAGQS